MLTVTDITNQSTEALYDTHNNKSKMPFTRLGTQQQQSEARCGHSFLHFTVRTERVSKEEHINMKLKQTVKCSQPQLSTDCNT